MHNEKLYEEVGKYIEENYVKKSDDIKLDKEMFGIFEKISELRKKLIVILKTMSLKLTSRWKYNLMRAL